MIEKIEKINQCGPYKDFSWPNNCNNFKKYNFIYGWNYSGKTTLSRIFKFLEDKKTNQDFSNISFKLKTDNGSITERDIGKDLNIRVFNEDFISENFKWDDVNKEIEPVLIVGQESIELNKELENKKKEKSKLLENKKSLEKEKNDKENAIEKDLTNKATEIRNILSITNPREFDKNELKNRIKKSEKYSLLENKELEKIKSKYTSKKFDKIKDIEFEFKVITYKAEVEKLLNKKIKATEIIQDFLNNPELSEWVYKGLGLHKDKDTCQFCGSPLTKERFDKLNQHFSKEYDNFIRELNSLKNTILNHKSDLQKLSFPDKARFYDEIQNDYDFKVQEIKKLINFLIKQLDDLVTELERKKENVFTKIPLEKSFDKNIEDKAKSFLKEINNLIDKHNTISDNLENEKQESKEKLIQHYVKDFLSNSDYEKTIGVIKQLNENIEQIDKKIQEIIQEIRDIEQQIEASSIGAEKINKLFKDFFGDDKLKIEKTENGKYKLFRENIIAKNLNTGERNIISLIYFFIKLEETGFVRRDAIIFIDDPVSSLDSNHMYSVYSFICQKIKDLKQVFITTHNFEFFNLLKDMNRYDLGNNEGNFYLVKRIKNTNSDYSTIENLPSLLLKFKSEYNYLFSAINEYQGKEDKNNFEQLFILPNIVRRFLELYLLTKYPDGKKFKDKANRLFSNIEKEKQKFILKFIDEHSHEENPQHASSFPDVEEITKVIRILLETLEKKDKEHYDALCESLKGEKRQTP